MPNVHSILKLAEANNIHTGYWKAQKRDGNATLHLCLFLTTVQVMQNIHEKKIL